MWLYLLVLLSFLDRAYGDRVMPCIVHTALLLVTWFSQHACAQCVRFGQHLVNQGATLVRLRRFTEMVYAPIHDGISGGRYLSHADLAYQTSDLQLRSHARYMRVVTIRYGRVALIETEGRF